MCSRSSDRTKHKVALKSKTTKQLLKKAGAKKSLFLMSSTQVLDTVDSAPEEVVLILPISSDSQLMLSGGFGSLLKVLWDFLQWCSLWMLLTKNSLILLDLKHFPRVTSPISPIKDRRLCCCHKPPAGCVCHSLSVVSAVLMLYRLSFWCSGSSWHARAQTLTTNCGSTTLAFEDPVEQPIKAVSLHWP